MRHRLFAVLAVLLLVVACAPAQETETAEEPAAEMEAEEAETEPMDEEAAVDAVRAEYVRAYNAGDAQALGELFTDDAATLFADGGVNEGRAAIVAGHEETLANDPTVQIDAAETMVMGDRAVQRGSYQVQMESEGADPVRFGGHYMTALRQTDGEWKIGAVITNYDSAPPAGIPAGALPETGPPPDETDSPVADLTAAYEEAFNAGDAAAVAGLYTEDTVAALANSPLARGRSEVEARVAQRLEAGSPQLTIHTVNTQELGDGWHIAGGWYEIAGDDMQQGGNWMNLVRTAEDGSHRIHWMVSNARPQGGDM